MPVLLAALDDLQAQTAPGPELLDPLHEFAGVTSIGKNAAQPTKAALEHCQDQPGSVPVLDGGRMDHDVENQTQRIHQEVSLASQCLLACIVAAHSSVVRYFNALRIDNRSGGGFFFPLWRRTWSRK